ncbi:carbohydrate kinase family protein [Pseudozobellia thermophila]|uniref:Fructokinase n=1 Tax=Pseudozobellia thermophila TaxID=192903 RepID=A0A1M6IR92_9FLAO|nr:carbohydrate kinase [Pseudozobellia thermophila]SHJ36878.1 fructokinase [Pseudozobellia thermophila]
MDKKINAVCFGEVLFDHFPTHSKIGGAPLNVSLRLTSYGVETALISSVGQDPEGKKIINYLTKLGVHTKGIHLQEKYPTGAVNVILNDKGAASYDIAYPVAWDKILANEYQKALVKASDFFVFGSLACRDSVSRTTLASLLKMAAYKVFDVNLRPPHYTPTLLVDLMEESDFIKFNDDELFEIAGHIGSKYNSMEQTIAYVAAKTKTGTICVTKGAYGAVLYRNETLYYNSGYRIKVLDTVGSGDSFLASVLYKLFNGESPQAALDYGCAVGAMVAKSEGANPILTKLKIEKFMNP